MTITVPSAVQSRKKVLHQFKMGLLRVYILFSLNSKKNITNPPRLCGVDFLELLRDELDMNLSPSTLYPILNEMEEAGMIHSNWVVGEDGKRRKFYHLLEHGRHELIRFCQQTKEPILELLAELPLGNIKICPHCGKSY